jgi:hypothetical protein
LAPIRAVWPLPALIASELGTGEAGVGVVVMPVLSLPPPHARRAASASIVGICMRGRKLDGTKSSFAIMLRLGEFANR